MSKENEKKTTKTNIQAHVMRRILKRVESALSRDVSKASLGDYIKLVQLEKEMDDREPPEVRARWMEHPEGSSSEE